MASHIAKWSAFNGAARPPLSISDRLDLVRFEDSFGDFIAAAWCHAGEPQKFQSKAYRLHRRSSDGGRAP
jgi:hypothetical protein